MLEGHKYDSKFQKMVYTPLHILNKDILHSKNYKYFK